MNKLALNFKIILLLIMLLVSSISLALTCEDKSPNWQKEGDAYFKNVEASYKPISQHNKTLVKELSDNIGGRWKGYGSQEVCKFVENTSELKNYPLRIQADISHDSDGTLTIEFTIEDEENDKVTSQHLDFFDDKNEHVIEAMSEYDISLIYKSTYFSMISTYNSNNFARNILVEAFTDIVFDGDKLIIYIMEYMNGVFSEKYSMELHR